MLKISPPSDLFPLVRSHSVSSQSLRSPPIFAGDGSAVAAYPEIRRQANLSASPYPFRFPPFFSLCPPSLPLPAPFAGGAKRRRVSRDSPSGESPRLAVPVPLLAILLSMPAHPSAPRPFRWRREAAPRIQKIRRQANLPAWPYPFRFSLSLPRVLAPPSAPRHFSLAARSGATYPKDSPSGESLRFGWGGLSRRGPAPSLIPRLPSHAPPFPQPSFTLGGGCREGGSPPDFPSCPAALPAGAGRFPHSYRSPQPRLVRTHRPSRSSNLGTAEIASFQAADVCEAKPSARPRPTGPGPKKGRRRESSPFFREAGPSRKRTHVRFRDSAPARL